MQKVALLILDGWGIGLPWAGNAIFLAKTPFYDESLIKFPNTSLQAAGKYVGLNPGEPGNSESGHLNIGAGKVVYQNVKHIFDLIKNGSFYQNKVLLHALSRVKKNQSNLHLIGLVSDGGIHSHIDQLFALLDLCKKEKVKNVFIHAICDGRDTEPQKALSYMEKLTNKLKSLNFGKISTISGRFFAMDRDRHFERTNRAYEVMSIAKGMKESNARSAISKAYQRGETDEYINPTVIFPKPIENDDAVIFFNVRGDRSRQLASAFYQDKKHKNLFLATFTFYGEYLSKVPFAFSPEKVNMPLAKVLSENGLTQFHIAETEKYAHVTYFFNGGIEKPFLKEDRLMIPSKKVKSFADFPQMSASEITEKMIDKIKQKKYQFVVANFANVDMVGHCCNLKSTITAVEEVNKQLRKAVEKLNVLGYTVVVTGDHGNAEQMVNSKTGETNPEHTENPVPFIIFDLKYKIKNSGKLADIAPTILSIMGLKIHREMTGKSLV